MLQWMSQDHRGCGRLGNTWKRDLEKEMWTAGFRFSEGGWRRQYKTDSGGNEWSLA